MFPAPWPWLEAKSGSCGITVRSDGRTPGSSGGGRGVHALTLPNPPAPCSGCWPKWARPLRCATSLPGRIAGFMVGAQRGSGWGRGLEGAQTGRTQGLLLTQPLRTWAGPPWSSVHLSCELGSQRAPWPLVWAGSRPALSGLLGGSPHLMVMCPALRGDSVQALPTVSPPSPRGSSYHPLHLMRLEISTLRPLLLVIYPTQVLLHRAASCHVLYRDPHSHRARRGAEYCGCSLNADGQGGMCHRPCRCSRVGRGPDRLWVWTLLRGFLVPSL